MYTVDRKRLQKLKDSISKSSKHFTSYEIECLIKIFYTFLGETTEKQGSIGIDRNAFRNILHTTFGMTDDMIMDRVFRGFDRDNDGFVSVTEWISGLCIFLRGSLEEKMKSQLPQPSLGEKSLWRRGPHSSSSPTIASD